MRCKKQFLILMAAILVLVVGGCVNRPPKIDCVADQTTVVEGNSLTLKATTSDPDRMGWGGDSDKLKLTWTADQGKVSGGELTGDANTPVSVSATFDSSGLDAGMYKVTAEVDDRKLKQSCSFDITVEKNKKAPTIECTPSSASVTEGKSTTLRARASDANGDSLTYSWTVDGKSVANNSSSLEFGTSGKSVGSHSARVKVTDVDGMSADCEFKVSVDKRPNTDPKVSLSLDKNEVHMGETVKATATATDAEGDPLTYSWTVGGNKRSETGSSINVNTAGMGGGAHSVSVTATDDRKGSGSANASFKVRENIIIQVDRRLNNEAKAKLDEIALKMQQHSQLRAKITGHTDDRGSDKGNEKAGMKRAGVAKDYLVKQHNIGESRIQTMSAGEGKPVADNKTAEGRKENRRVEIELSVP